MAALLRLSITLVSLAFRLLVGLRLGIPLLYTVLMLTVCSEWAAANNGMAFGILLALIGAVGFSWVVTLVRKVKAI